MVNGSRAKIRRGQVVKAILRWSKTYLPTLITQHTGKANQDFDRSCRTIHIITIIRHNKIIMLILAPNCHFLLAGLRDECVLPVLIDLRHGE